MQNTTSKHFHKFRRWFVLIVKLWLTSQTENNCTYKDSITVRSLIFWICLFGIANVCTALLTLFL